MLSTADRLARRSALMPSGCIEWQGSRSAKGYGRMWVGRKCKQAHRVAFELDVGSIPDGLQVLHRCDNPPCVNPAHLFTGTNLDNVRDKLAKGRLPRGELRINAKLTDQAVREIRASEFGKKRLAKIYGVCPTVILEVKRCLRWPHIGGAA